MSRPPWAVPADNSFGRLRRRFSGRAGELCPSEWPRPAREQPKRLAAQGATRARRGRGRRQGRAQRAQPTPPDRENPSRAILLTHDFIGGRGAPPPRFARSRLRRSPPSAPTSRGAHPPPAHRRRAPARSGGAAVRLVATAHFSTDRVPAASLSRFPTRHIRKSVTGLADCRANPAVTALDKADDDHQNRPDDRALQ